MKSRKNYFNRLIAQLKSWAAESTLLDIMAEEETVAKVKHQFIEKLRY
ncbi:MAG: hypothetical protein V1682_02295 [Candidatus Omnitrophota bacterium]